MGSYASLTGCVSKVDGCQSNGFGRRRAQIRNHRQVSRFCCCFVSINRLIYCIRYPKYLDGYLKLLKGVEGLNIRASLKDSKLAVDDQIKCLLDLAMDPVLLGVCYTGFAPWI